MRVVTAIAIWIVILGSLFSFQHHRRKLQASQSATRPPVRAMASARYSLAVTPTFKAEPDPFALNIDDTDGSAALLVRMTGEDLLRVTDQVAPGETLRVETLPDIQVGLNEVYVEGVPPTAQSQQRHAILVELFRDDVSIQEASFWSVPGGKVTGVLRFEVLEDEEKEANHDH